MLPVADAHVRLVLLHHVAVRLAQASVRELQAAGIETEQVERLRHLSPLDFHRLAAMRDLTIGVAVDATGLKAGLRAVALANEARLQEDYFIRHGASWRLISTLFKIRRKVLLQRRHDIGAWRPAGRVRLPDYTTRERVYRVWMGMEQVAPRLRYYRLHQAFPQFPIAVLEAVVRAFEVDQ